MKAATISDYGSMVYLTIESEDALRNKTVYFGTPTEARTALYGLETLMPELKPYARVRTQTADGRTLTMMTVGDGIYWTDSEYEFGVDEDGWPVDEHGRKFDLFDCRVGVDRTKVPVILLSYDSEVHRRFWTPKQAIEASETIGDMFGDESLQIWVQTSDGYRLFYSPKHSGANAPYHWHDNDLSFEANFDGWPIESTGELLDLQQPLVTTGSLQTARKPEVFTPPPQAPLPRPNFVLQDWVAAIPMMQQTVLMTALRGPDSTPKYGPAKYLLRWYRRCILLSAMDRKVLGDPVEANGGSFTGPSMSSIEMLKAQEEFWADYPKGKPRLIIEPWEPRMDALVGEYMQNLDATPYHYHGHFMHGAQVLGVQHPDRAIRCWWWKVYVRLVHELHLHPESPEEMNKRLGDNRAEWLARADVALSD